MKISKTIYPPNQPKINTWYKYINQQVKKNKGFNTKNTTK